MKKVKKYYPGVNNLTGNTYSTTGGWNYGFGGNSEMVNPGNAALQQYTTTSSSTIRNGESAASGDISQLINSKNKLSFKDKAGAFMGNYGSAIASAAGSIAPLLMKKPNPNAKPYKKGSKMVKYKNGGKDLNNLSFKDTEELVKADLLSNKDYLISKLPKFAQKAFAKKAMSRIEQADQEYNEAYKDVYSSKEAEKTPVEENRVMRQVVKKRQTPQTIQTPTVETPKEEISLLNTSGPRENPESPSAQRTLLQIRRMEGEAESEKERIKKIQRKLGVKDDGIWGPKTQAAWTASKRKKVPQVKNTTIEEDVDAPEIPQKNTLPLQEKKVKTLVKYDGKPSQFAGFGGGRFGGGGASGDFKTGTKNLNTNMKKRKSLIKYEGGVEDATLSSGLAANYAEAQSMKANAEDRKRAFLQKNIENQPPSDMRRESTTLTPTMAYGQTSTPKLSSPKSLGNNKVRAYQQKLKDAGYNIKVDGIWGKETQRIHNAYTKGKTIDTSRRGTVNTGQGPTIQNAQNLKEARALGAKGTVLDQVTVTAPAKKTYNQFDSPVLRQANMEALGRWRAEDAKTQAIADAKRKARQAEIARNSQSLPSDTEANKYSFNAGNKGQGTDVTAIQNESQLRNKLVGKGERISANGRIQTFAGGTPSLEAGKKPSMYEKIDARLGGILPGGLNRKESKELRVANRAERLKEKINSLKGEYSAITGKQDSDLIKYSEYGPYEEKYKAPETPKTKVDEMIQQSTTPPAKTETKTETPASTVVKKSSSKNQKRKGGSGSSGGSEKTSAPAESSLFKNGVAVKNFKDKKTGRSYYTNGRVFDEKTGKMGKYTSDNKTVKFSWDKPKAAPKRKGDDTYMDEVIDIGSRTIGSLGGAALAGGSTFGVGSVAGGIVGDRAGKAFGNWLNKKLGYREEDDKSQEGYSLGEAAFGAIGGAGGRLVKPVGGAVMKFAGKEAAKMAASPLGRAVGATGRAAGKLVGRGGSKATAQAGGQAASQGASQAASQAASKGTAQAAKITLKPGKFATTRGNGGKFTVNPAKQGKGTYTGPKAPAKGSPTPSKVYPKNSSANTATPAAPAQGAVQGPAQANFRQSVGNVTRTAGRKARETGKKAINFVKNNKKKSAIAAGTVGAGMYAASQMKTGG